MLKKMNLPNKLSLLRIALVPLFVVFIYIYSFNLDYAMYIALGIYIVASITDALDGHIARKNKITTKFGKLVDPLADKLLVAAGFIMLTDLGIIPGLITFAVIFRDLWVGTLRMFAASKNVTVAAHLSGKIKTLFTMPTIVFAMLDVIVNKSNSGFFAFTNNSILNLGGILVNSCMSILLVSVVITTIWSLIDYTLKLVKYIDFE